MSQNLLISLRKNVSSEDSFYDCIYDENGSLEILLNDWLFYDSKNGVYVGPWKIKIKDQCLMDKFTADFLQIKNHCPQLVSFDDVWSIWDGNGNQIHLSQKEDRFHRAIINDVVQKL